VFVYSAQELLNQKIEVLLPERYHRKHADHRSHFFADPKLRPMGAGLKLYGVRKDGSEFPVEISLSPLETEDGLLVSGAIRDISERKRADEELRLKEERFRLMVSEIKDYAIVMLDLEGKVISWNAGAERIKGYSSEEILGQHFSRFYPPDDLKEERAAAELKFAAKEGRVEDEGWRVRKDGSFFWANVVVTALRDEGGRLRGFVKVTRDVSERKRIEQELELRNAQLLSSNSELEAFCYSVSHDLRAPLRGIDGFSQALLEDYSGRLDDTGKQYLERVRLGAQRMASLIDDLLELSRITRAEIQRQHVDLSEMARSVIHEISRQDPSREVEFVIAPGLHAEVDPRLMRTVLENLLGNAWKFTSRCSHARIEFGRTQATGLGAFFVRDNGAGFDLMAAGYSVRSSACMLQRNFPAQGWDSRRYSGSFIGTEAACGRRARLTKGQHSFSRCGRTWLAKAPRLQLGFPILLRNTCELDGDVNTTINLARRPRHGKQSHFAGRRQSR
jgi:PAS domain S-box-containing protein